jgi:hypothetical protein
MERKVLGWTLSGLAVCLLVTGWLVFKNRTAAIKTVVWCTPGCHFNPVDTKIPDWCLVWSGPDGYCKRTGKSNFSCRLTLEISDDDREEIKRTVPAILEKWPVKSNMFSCLKISKSQIKSGGMACLPGCSFASLNSSPQSFDPEIGPSRLEQQRQRQRIHVPEWCQKWTDQCNTCNFTGPFRRLGAIRTLGSVGCTLIGCSRQSSSIYCINLR